MDKKYQDVHLHDYKNKCDLDVLREITIRKIIKTPDSFLITYITYNGKYGEKIIPIKPYQCIIID